MKKKSKKKTIQMSLEGAKIEDIKTIMDPLLNVELKIPKNGYLIDFITGNVVEDKPEERVRQKIEQFLVKNRGYDKSDIEVEKKIEVSIGRKKEPIKADLVIYYNGEPFITIECKSLIEEIEVYKNQALSYSILLALTNSKPADYTIITNWRDTLVFETLNPRIPIADTIEWIPRKEEVPKYLKKKLRVSEEDIERAKRTAITFTNPKRIAELFDICHNILRTQRGLDAKERLYEMCKLILVKLHEEKRERAGQINRFTTKALDQIIKIHGKKYNEEKFINEIFDEVKKDFIGLFNDVDKIELRPHVIREIVEILEPYSFLETGEDVLGVAFEVFLKETMTGKELGEFFTPRELVDFMVKLVDPKFGEYILDPACGTGGFLLHSFWYLSEKIRNTFPENEWNQRIKELSKYLWGIDIYRYLVKLCKMNLNIHGCGYENIYRANALDLIDDDIPEIEVDDRRVREKIKSVLEERGGFDIILTNPPFGSGEKQKERNPNILKRYELITRYKSGQKKGEIKPQIPQILFIELCIKLLRPGGRMAIVLPDGILNNLGEEYENTREFIKRETIIKAIIDLPPGTFYPYGSNVKASILYLQKKRNPDEEQGDVFAAVVEEVGYDRHTERYTKIPQNDLPLVLKEFKRLMGG